MIVALWEVFWIPGDVFASPFEVIRASDESVPVCFLPELSGPVEGFVDLIGREAFQGMEDVFQGPAFLQSKESVDVVWHDDKGVEEVALFVEMMKGVGYNGMVLTEAAGAVGFIELVFKGDDEASLILGGCFVIPGFGMGF